MFKNYLKIAFRNLWKSKGFSFINITGLAVGMAGAILILLWIQNELSFDQFHAKKDNLYEAWNRDAFDGKLQCWGTTPKIMGPTLKLEYAEVKETARVNWDNDFLFAVGDKKVKITGTMVDPGFLTMFSFPLVQGNMLSALSSPSSVVITQKLAKSLFGDQDAMGKVIKVENKDNFTVTGVLKDLPNNTQFDFQYLLPFSYIKKLGWYDEYWGNNSVQTYVELKDHTSVDLMNAKIKNITKKHSNSTEDEEVFLNPVSKLHLYSRFKDGKIVGGKIETVRLFGIVAAFILLIACINFMNLSTARSEKRAKEVGIRKVVGAGKGLLVAQFIGESILLSFIAAIIALLIVIIALPYFNDLVNKRLDIPYQSVSFWLSGLLFIVVTGIIAGSYPAFFLSSFQPVKILKGTYKAANALVTPRKVLVILQFTFAIVLIISTIVIQRQIRYAQDRDTGYNKDNLVYHDLTGDLGKNFELIKQDLLNKGVATSVCKTSAAITQGNSDTWGIDWAGKAPNAKIDFDMIACRNDFIKTIGLKLVAGRDIDLKNYPTDTLACMFNETGIKAMGLKGDGVGQTIKNDGGTYRIVGVFKDFILRSPYSPMRPMFIKGASWSNVINMRLSSANSTANNLAMAADIFKKYNPAFPFEYHFVDKEYEHKFDDEQRTATLSAVFAFLTIFISCLGLFGLATYMAENRIKEIGVRKVLGASVGSITALLATDFVQLVLIAIGFGSLIAWYLMHLWLENYKYYQVAMSWWIFALSGLLAIAIALLTVSFQSIRAAIANPVKSLRSE